MGMRDPIKATCCYCGKENVLVCIKDGGCYNCIDHVNCDLNPRHLVSNVEGMKNPYPGTCNICGNTHVLVCRSCGACGRCSKHTGC